MNKEQRARACQPWLNYPCPVCHNPIGKQCWIEDGSFFKYHRERYTPSYDRLSGAFLSKREFPLIKGRRYSAYCGVNAGKDGHDKCPGTCFMKGFHGVRMVCQCQCQCHGKVKAYVEPRPVKTLNPLYTKFCGTGKHEKCKKRRKLPNNLYAPCECPCHQVENSFRN